MHRITAVLVTPVLAASTLVPAASAAAPAGAAAPQSRYQGQAFDATNHHRDKRDRTDLRADSCVQKFAVRQARRMARQDRMFHQALRPILRKCHLTTVGENVAYGYPNGRSVVNEGWMHSTGHRRNILNPSYRLLGMGARQSDDGTWYAAQVFGAR